MRAALGTLWSMSRAQRSGSMRESCHFAQQLAAGAGVDEPAPRKPSVVDAPGASVPFQAALRKVASVPVWLTVEFHACVTVWLPGNTRRTAHPLSVAEPALVTLTSPWKPLFQDPITLYEAEQLEDVDGDGVGVGFPPEISGARAGYHLSDIFWLPESFGCTPSYVSVASLKPVHWSTTLIGDWAVVLPAAQAGIAALKVTTRWAQSEQLLGFIGRILATRIFMAGLLARIWSTRV